MQKMKFQLTMDVESSEFPERKVSEILRNLANEIDAASQGGTDFTGIKVFGLKESMEDEKEVGHCRFVSNLT